MTQEDAGDPLQHSASCMAGGVGIQLGAHGGGKISSTEPAIAQRGQDETAAQRQYAHESLSAMQNEHGCGEDQRVGNRVRSNQRHQEEGDPEEPGLRPGPQRQDGYSQQKQQEWN